MEDRSSILFKEKLLAQAGFLSLPKDWSIVQIAEILSEDRGISVGVMYPGEHDPFGIPLIKVGDLTDNLINPNPEFHITPQKHYEYRRTAFEGGEILLTLVGDVGKCAIVPSKMVGWNAARALAVIRLKNPKDANYIRLCLLSRPLQHLMQIWANTTVQVTLNLKEIKQLPLPWPPSEERAGISRILDTLDEKIELNHRMNETLEAIARAIFKSWFVDFDPVRAKMEGREPYGMDTETATLFPSSFVDSPVGKIPRGWQIVSLDDVTEFMLGGDWGNNELTEVATNPAFCMRGADIPDLQGAGLGKMPLRYLRSSSLEKRRLIPGDIVIEISGGSPTQSTGRPVLISHAILQELTYPLVCSNFCRMLHLISGVPSHFIYLWLRWLYMSGTFLEFENGTTGIKNLALTVFSEQKRLLLPPFAILNQFELVVKPLFAAQQSNGAQSRTLVNIRDTLLPKLLSGEIRLKDAEKYVEAHV